MAFTEVLGLGTSILGMFQANKQAKRQQKMFEQQLALQREQMAINQGYAEDAMAKQDTRNSELREWEQWQRATAAQERDYQMQEADRYADQMLSERQFEIDRQVRADQEAARIQAFQLEEMLNNQRISGEERKYAIAQLEQARAVASEERTADLKRQYENQERAKIQREFMMGAYTDATTAAREEQNRDLAMRDRITGQIDSLSGTVRAAYDAMGQAPTVERLSKADIDSEIARRTEQYTSDVDRAADRVASINEAGLVRSGMDRSTTGTAARGEVAGRLADEYQSARNRAYDDALKYITGKSDALTGNVNDIMANRSSVLGEVSGVGSTGLEALMNLPGIASRVGAYDAARMVGDGIYEGQIGSANDYQAPVQINSRIYDNMNITPGMSDYTVGTSAGYNRANYVDSASTQPSTLILENPGTYFGYANANQANLLESYGTMSSNARTRSDEYSALFGSQLSSYLNDNKDKINSKFSSMFGSGSSGSTNARDAARSSGTFRGMG